MAGTARRPLLGYQPRRRAVLRSQSRDGSQGPNAGGLGAGGAQGALIRTEPVPVKVKGPKTNVIAPVAAFAVMVTGVPRNEGLLVATTDPPRVTTEPATDPLVNLIVHAPGLPGAPETPVPVGGTSNPKPVKALAVPWPVAATWSVNGSTAFVTSPSTCASSGQKRPKLVPRTRRPSPRGSEDARKRRRCPTEGEGHLRKGRASSDRRRRAFSELPVGRDRQPRHRAPSGWSSRTRTASTSLAEM